MQERLGKSTKERTENLEEFFRQHTIMNSQAFVKENEVYEKLKTKLRFVDEKTKVQELNLIGEDSKLYERLLFPVREPDANIRRGLHRINRLKVGVSYPFLLKVYRLYSVPERKVEQTDFIDILSTIESFAIRRLFHNAPTNSLNKFFASLCGLNEDNIAGELKNTIASKQNWEAQYCPTDSEFEEDILTFQIYKESSDRCHFVLETLEENMSDPEPVKLEDLTIEHVMPETLTDNWKQYLGTDWERIYNTYLNTLPNLTLISGAKNSSLQNSLFARKKTEWYDKSNVSLTKEIRDNHQDWTEKDIRRRAKTLATRAISIWPRPS
jgi:hypothetical protein